MKRVIFSEIAVRELEDASRFYAMEFEGLGQQFRSEVRAAAKRIAEYPRT